MIENLKLALKSKDVKQVLEVLRNPELGKVVPSTFEGEQFGIRGLTRAFPGAERAAIVKEFVEQDIRVSSEGASIKVIEPFLVNEYPYVYQHPIAAPINPVSNVTIIDSKTGQTMELPVFAFSLARHQFGMAYTISMQDGFDTESLRNIDFKAAVDSMVEAGMTSINPREVDSIQVALNDAPEIFKYLNLEALAISTSKTGGAMTITSDITMNGVNYSAGTVIKPTDSSDLSILSNPAFAALARSLDAKDTAGIFASLEALKATPEIFSFVNLGSILKTSPELAADIIRFITDNNGHANGHIFTATDTKYVIEPIVKYASDRSMVEVVDMLVSHPNSAVQKDLSPMMFYDLGQKTNSFDHNKYELLPAESVLLHLLNTNIEAAKKYIIQREDKILWQEMVISTGPDSALSKSIELGIFTIDEALKNCPADTHLGDVMSHIIHSPKDIDMLLAHGVSLLRNNGNSKGTPIQYFIGQDRWDIVDRLLDPSLNLPLEDSLYIQDSTTRTYVRGKSSLIMLVESGRYDIKQLLAHPSIAKGINDPHNIMDLTKIVQDPSLLLKYVNWNQNIYSSEGHTPFFDTTPLLNRFIKDGKWDIVDLLIHSSEVKLIVSTLKNNVVIEDSISLLLASGRYTLEDLLELPSIKAEDYKANDLLAMIDTYPQIVASLICKGANYQNAFGENVLPYAIKNHHGVVTKAIFAREDFDPSIYVSRSNSYISLSQHFIEEGNWFMLNKLIALQSFNSNELCIGVSKIAMEKPSLAIKYIVGGYPIDGFVSYGQDKVNPFICFALDNNLMTVVEAIFARVDFNPAMSVYANSYNQSLFEYMLGNNNLAAVEAWIKYGGDVNAVVSDGKTPLHLAVEQNILDLADLLVKHGADTNIPGPYGNTPLHLVAQHNPPMVALLVKAGANLEATNVAGETPCTTLLDKVSLFTKEQMISVNYKEVIKAIMQSMPLVKAMLQGPQPSTLDVSHEDTFKAMMKHYYTMFGKYPSDTYKLEQLTLPFLAARKVWKNAASLTEANEMFSHSVSLMRLIDPFNEGVVAEAPHVDVAGAADAVVDAAS